MMQRMETIQREQEERILSSVTKKSSTIKSSASVSWLRVNVTIRAGFYLL